MAGLALPGLFSAQPEARFRTAGVLLGTAAGELTAGAVAQFIDWEPSAVLSLFLLDSLGTLAGWGIGLAGSSESAAPNAGLLLGSALSLAVGSQVARSLHFTDTDISLVAASSLWGAMLGLGLPPALGYTFREHGRQIAGTMLLGLGGLGIGAVAVSHRVLVKPWDVWATVAGGGGWGIYLSTMALLAVDNPSQQSAAIALLAAGNGGLLLTSYLLCQGASPRQVGIASLGGMAGAITGTIATAFFTVEKNTLLRGNLVGTSLGLAGGALVAVLVGPGAPEAVEPAKIAGASGFPRLAFQGLSSQPVFGRSGRVDGMAITAVMRVE